MKASELSQADVAQLVDLSKKGDRRAYDQLVYLYYERILSYVARMVHDPIEAEDITQEAFIKAYRNLPDFLGNSAFQSWLHCIAINLTIDSIRRRRKRGNTYSLDAPLDTEEGQMGREQEDVHGPGPLESLETAELQYEVHRAIDKLSKKLRGVLVLYELMGLKYEEIAEVLDVPLGTVKSRIYKARLEVAKLLLEAGLMDKEEMQKLYAQRPSLIPTERKCKYTRRQAPRLPEEGNDMLTQLRKYSEQLKGHWDKIADKRMLDAAKDGAPDIQGNETVEQYLTRRAKELLASRSNPDHEKGNTTELMEVYDTLRFRDCRDDFEWKLRELVNKANAQRLAELLFDFGDPTAFFPKLAEAPQEHGLGEGTSVWANMAQATREVFEGKPMTSVRTIALALKVPVPMVIYLGLRYLEKAEEIPAGTKPNNLPADLAEALDALPTMRQFPFISHQADHAVLPEERLVADITAFMRSLASGHPRLIEFVEGLVDIEDDETSVCHCLAILKELGANTEEVTPVIIACFSTTLRQAAQIYEKIKPEEPTEEEERDGKGGEGGQGDAAGGGTIIGDDGAGGLGGAEGGTEDQGEILRFLVKGHEYVKRGAWSILAKDALGDRDFLFAPLSDQETCEAWAIRMYGKGIPWIAIGYLLGGKSVNAIQVHFGKPTAPKLVEPSEADVAKYEYMKRLVGFVADGIIRCATEGPNKGLDLEHLTSLSGMTHGQMVASLRGNGKGHTPVPPPPDDEAERMHKVREILTGSADNQRMMALTADPKWPDIPDGVTVTNYAQILKGAKVNAELVTQAIYDAYGLAELCEFDVIEQWYADLVPIIPLPPPSPITDPVPVKPGKPMSPFSPAMEGAIKGLVRIDPKLLAQVLYDLTGLNPIELLELIHGEWVKALAAKPTGSTGHNQES